jgi:hypothetical protein
MQQLIVKVWLTNCGLCLDISMHTLKSPENPLGRFAVSEDGNVVVAGEHPMDTELGGVNAWDMRRLDRPIFRATPPLPTAECGYVEAVECARGVVVSAHESSRVYLWCVPPELVPLLNHF